MQNDYLYQEIAVSPKLKSSIECYWSMMAIKSNRQLSVLPDGCFDIVIYIRPETDNDIVLTGLWDKKIEVQLYRGIDTVGVRFYPSSIDKFFNCTIAELKNTKVKFHQKMLKQYQGVDLSLLYRANSIKQILDFYQIYFEYSLESEHCASIFDYIFSLNSSDSVEKIASLLGLSSRQLLRKHQQTLGVTTKNYLNIIRFIEAKKLLQQGSSFNDIVFECGYADQSHFIREFKKYSSQTPQEFCEEFLNNNF